MDGLLDRHTGLREIYDLTAYKETRSLAFLHHLVDMMKPRNILELGTGRGCSTAFMALALDGGIIHSIDNYKRPDINGSEMVKTSLVGCGVLEKVNLVKGNTHECGVLVTDSPDLVFMDASHEAGNLHKEYASMKRRLPAAHVVVVDDALSNDVMNFVMDLLKLETYPFSVILPYHQGVAALPTNLTLLDLVNAAIQKVERGYF